MNKAAMTWPSAQLLDGTWRVKPDPDGSKDEFAKGVGSGAESIRVPGSLCMLGGEPEGIFWYERSFIPESFESGCRAWLTFGSVEYSCRVYVNGEFVGAHEGKQAEFTLEATAAVRPHESNLLTVRVSYARKTVVEGIDGRDILGLCDGGGIHQHVVFTVTGPGRIDFVHASGSLQTSCVEIELDCNGADGGRVQAVVAGGYHGGQRTRVSAAAQVKGEQTRLSISVPVDGPLPWTCDAPHLYEVEISLYTADGSLSDVRTLRTGFRSLSVSAEGYFILNGSRIYLKCAHGGTVTPFAVYSDPRAIALNRAYVTAMKAAGFNCIRFLTGTPAPDMLDLCDELGMMVYQECPSSWMPGGGETVLASEARQAPGEVERRYLNDLKNMLLQDLNHPCIVLWGLLNETVYCRRYLAALGALSLVRSIDRTRLVLLSSGSWDRDLKNGTVCNPFSDTWECLWGMEGTDHESVEQTGCPSSGGTDEPDKRFSAVCYYSGAGDVHVYPSAEVNTGLFDWMETLGASSRPVFLSEHGIGSQYDYYSLARYLESIEEAPEHGHARELAKANDALLKRFIKKEGLTALYPSPRDLLLDSYAEQAKYREQSFSMVRANPHIVGYSMTAVQDQGFAGEGFIGLMGEFKPTQMDVMQDGWAPLRWCLLTNPTHIYTNKPIRLRACLANEGILAPGRYPATLCVYNDDRLIWTYRTEAVIEQPRPGKSTPLSCTVFDEVLVIPGLSAGRWVFSATLDSGGFARGGKVEFDVSDFNDLPDLSFPIYVSGALPEHVTSLLSSCGARLEPLTPACAAGVTVVGSLEDAKAWDAVYKQIADGGQAAFLDPYSLIADKGTFKPYNDCRTAVNLRCGDGAAELVGHREWLYHRVVIGKPSPLTQGLRATRMLDQNYYNSVMSQLYFRLSSAPEESAVVTFAMDVRCSAGSESQSGVMLGRARFGNGGYAFCAFDVLRNPGHPAADRLIANLACDAARRLG